MTAIEKYYNKVDNSTLNTTNLNREFRTIWKNINEEFSESISIEEQRLLQLEEEILLITKSIEQGLRPKFSRTYKDEKGNEIEEFSPDFRKYGLEEQEYFRRRYDTTSNIYLKSEYGLYLICCGKIAHNNDKLELCVIIQNLVDQYLHEAKKNPEKEFDFLIPAFTRCLDIFLILHRAGKPLENEFCEFVLKLQNWCLTTNLEDHSFYRLASFVLDTFTTQSKSVKNIIDSLAILNRIEKYIEELKKGESDPLISISKKVIAFCHSFKLEPNISYHNLIGRRYEDAGDGEIPNERWGSAVHNYQDAVKYYKLGASDDSVQRCLKKISEHKGKFKMGVVSVEGEDEMNFRLNELIDSTVSNGNLADILGVIMGKGVLPNMEYLKAEAKKAGKGNRLVNFMSVMAMDKFGNTIRVYDSKDERERYHLFSSLDIATQIYLQVSKPVFIRVLQEKKLTVNQIIGMFMSSWMNQEVSWNRGGDIQKIKPVEAVIPGVINFHGQMDFWIKDNTYEPSFVCSVDSMVLKIEYLLRNMARKLEIPTFKHWYNSEGVMITEEKSMSLLLSDLEDFLREDDILLIKYWFCEKGGYNVRNNACHGLFDAHEYGFEKALLCLNVLLRLAFYQFEK